MDIPMCCNQKQCLHNRGPLFLFVLKWKPERPPAILDTNTQLSVHQHPFATPRGNQHHSKRPLMRKPTPIGKETTPMWKPTHLDTNTHFSGHQHPTPISKGKHPFLQFIVFGPFGRTHSIFQWNHPFVYPPPPPPPPPPLFWATPTHR